MVLDFNTRKTKPATPDVLNPPHLAVYQLAVAQGGSTSSKSSDPGRARLVRLRAVAPAGKSETRAARVVWLVANGMVEPDRILGLTFTRKAAGELQQRIRARLKMLGYALGSDPQLMTEPTVLTYAAYAGRVVDEH